MNVGSAFITIKPDTSKFRADLTRQLKPLLVQAEKSLKGIKVDVQANTGYANRAIATLARNAKDLDKMKVTVTPAVDVAKGRAQLRALENQLRRLDGRTANVRVDSSTGNVGEAIRDADRSMRSFDSTAKSTKKSGDDLNKSLGGLVGGFGALAAAQALIKTPLMIEGITAAIGGATALGGAAVALVAALTPLVGLLPVAGAGGLALAQGFGVAKLASLGLADAMKASTKSDEAVEAARKKLSAATREFGANSTQAKAAQKALTAELDEQKRVFDDVSPAAARFGRLLLDLKPKLKDIQELAAEGLFPGAERGLRSLTDGLLPTFRTAVDGTAKTLGSLAAEAGKVLGSGFFAGRFAAIAARNDVIMQSLGRAAIGLAAPLVRILDTAGPLAARFASLAEKQSGVLAAFVKSREESGRLDKAFATVDITARRLGTIVGAIGRTLGTVFREAMPAGQEYLAMLISGTTHMRDLAGVAAKSGALRKFFDDTVPVTREFAGLIGDVVKGLAGIGRGVMPELTPLLQLIRSDLIPAVLNLVSTLDTQFLAALVRLATTGANFLATFATATPVLTGVVGLLESLLRVANFLGNELGPLSPLIINMVAALGSLGAVSAALKIGRMISEFAGARAGFSLFAGGADGAERSAGRLSRAVGGLGTALSRLSIYAAVGYALKSTFDQLAPSIDKTVAAIAKGPATADAFFKEVQKLNKPGFFDAFALSAKNLFEHGPFKAASEATKEISVKATDAFRKLAQSSAETAVAVRNSMERSGQSTEAFDRILGELGISQKLAADATNLLTGALDRQAGQFLTASGNEVAYQEALDNLTDALSRNTATFDADTAAGRENIRARDALFVSIGNIVDALVVEANQDGITQEAQDGVLKKLHELRDSGYPGAREQADLYIRKVEAIPADKTTKINVDSAEAHAAIAAIMEEFNAIDGRVATLSVQLYGLENARSNLAAIQSDFGDITKSFPGRHAGGPVKKDEAYVVGEKRAELFVPDQSGYILPKVPPSAIPNPIGGTPGHAAASAPSTDLSGLTAAVRAQTALLERMANHSHPVNIDGRAAGAATAPHVAEANRRTFTARSRR